VSGVIADPAPALADPHGMQRSLWEFDQVVSASKLVSSSLNPILPPLCFFYRYDGTPNYGSEQERDTGRFVDFAYNAGGPSPPAPLNQPME
jgi:hypothetical protein